MPGMGKILIISIALSFLAGCGHEEKPGYARIKHSGVLRIGTDATYPPFEYNDDKTGQLIGFDIDLMKAICKNLDLKPNALSGICSSSPLHIRELHGFTNIPVFNSAEPDINSLAEILCSSTKHKKKNRVTSNRDRSRPVIQQASG